MSEVKQRRILVTAAGGNQGIKVIPALKAAGFTIRAFRASAGREAELLDLGADEVFSGNAADRSTIAAAVAGMDAVFHVGPTASRYEREMGFAVVDAVRDAGNVHLIYSSVLHALSSKLVQHKIKRDIEEYIHEAGIFNTILQPADYMMPGMLDSAFSTGTLNLPFYMNNRQSMVDLDDVAQVTTTVARERDSHFGATYELCGPGLHAGEDIAAAAAEASGSVVKLQRTTADDYFAAAFGGADVRDFRHEYSVLLSVEAWYRQYEFVGNSNVLHWLLGRAPTSLNQFAAREWQRWVDRR